MPFYRERVFARIDPSTRRRVDFGLALAKFKGKLAKRLVDTGGLAKKDGIPHRFEIPALDPIDADVERWLNSAYEPDERSMTEPAAPQNSTDEEASGGSAFATWLAIGISVGTAIGVATDNVALGVAIGTSLGVSIGVMRREALQSKPTDTE